jgi:hypothetical protein
MRCACTVSRARILLITQKSIDSTPRSNYWSLLLDTSYECEWIGKIHIKFYLNVYLEMGLFRDDSGVNDASR